MASPTSPLGTNSVPRPHDVGGGPNASPSSVLNASLNASSTFSAHIPTSPAPGDPAFPAYYRTLDLSGKLDANRQIESLNQGIIPGARPISPLSIASEELITIVHDDAVRNALVKGLPSKLLVKVSKLLSRVRNAVTPAASIATNSSKARVSLTDRRYIHFGDFQEVTSIGGLGPSDIIDFDPCWFQTEEITPIPLCVFAPDAMRLLVRSPPMMKVYPSGVKRVIFDIQQFLETNNLSDENLDIIDFMWASRNWIRFHEERETAASKATFGDTWSRRLHAHFDFFFDQPCTRFFYKYWMPIERDLRFTLLRTKKCEELQYHLRWQGMLQVARFDGYSKGFGPPPVHPSIPEHIRNAYDSAHSAYPSYSAGGPSGNHPFHSGSGRGSGGSGARRGRRHGGSRLSPYAAPS